MRRDTLMMGLVISVRNLECDVQVRNKHEMLRQSCIDVLCCETENREAKTRQYNFRARRRVRESRRFYTYRHIQLVGPNARRKRRRKNPLNTSENIGLKPLTIVDFPSHRSQRRPTPAYTAQTRTKSSATLPGSVRFPSEPQARQHSTEQQEFQNRGEP